MGCRTSDRSSPLADGTTSASSPNFDAMPQSSDPCNSSANSTLSTLSRSRLIKLRYSLLRVIGRGAFGQALLAINTQTNQRCVVKRLNSSIAGATALSGQEATGSGGRADGRKNPVKADAVLRESLNEITALAAVRHPYVVEFHEAWVEDADAHLHIAMEYCAGGDLHSFTKRNYPMDELVLRRWTAQALLALDHLHHLRIIHRDIKLQNIFLSADFQTVKLGDFGLSKFLRRSDESAMTTAGTPYYFSPEIANGHTHNRKTDLWSLGVVLYYLLEGAMPFEASTLLDLVRAITTQPPAPFRRARRYSAELLDLCRRMLTKDATARPSAAELLASPCLDETVQALHAEGGLAGGVLVRMRTLSVKQANGRGAFLSVNVRRQPSRGAEVLAQIARGDAVTVARVLKRSTDNDDELWHQVLEPVRGYCIATYNGQRLFEPVEAGDDAPRQQSSVDPENMRRGMPAKGISPSRRRPSPILIPGASRGASPVRSSDDRRTGVPALGSPLGHGLPNQQAYRRVGGSFHHQAPVSPADRRPTANSPIRHRASPRRALDFGADNDPVWMDRDQVAVVDGNSARIEAARRRRASQLQRRTSGGGASDLGRISPVNRAGSPISPISLVYGRHRSPFQ
jgi:serine/threonine protein kinase